MSEEAKSQSVTMKTYLFLEEIYLRAGDESKEEKDAKDIMDLIWNLLTSEEQDRLRSRLITPGIGELEAAALCHGIKEGSQMSRFLLWVGSECFEGREVQNFAVLTARAKELVQMFLADEKQPVIQGSVSLKTSFSVAVMGDARCGKCGTTFNGCACPNCNTLQENQKP